MDYNLSQIMQAWGTPAEDLTPSTLRALKRALRGALESGLDSELAGRIREGAEALLKEFQIAANEAERTAGDLPEHSPLHDLYDLSFDSYEAAYSAIEPLAELTSDWSEDKLETAHHHLTQAERKVAESQQMWKQEALNSLPSCARCGHSEESPGTCPECQTDLLFPDRRAQERDLSEQAVLGAEFHTVFNVYLDLKSGRTTLRQVLATAVPLRKTVNQWTQLIRSGALETLDEQLAQTLEDCVVESNIGLDQLEQARTTRHWQDINDGWRRLFKAGARLQRTLPDLYRAMGQQNRALELEGSFRNRDFTAA